MNSAKFFPRCRACRQNPSLLLALSFLTMAGSLTAAAFTANVEGEPAPAEHTSEHAPFELTPDIIKRAIETNGNNPVCFPEGGSAWFGSSADCAGHQLYKAEDFGLTSPGGSLQSEPTPEQMKEPMQQDTGNPTGSGLTPEAIREAIKANNGHPVCFPNGTGWTGGFSCAGLPIYKPEDYDLPPAPGGQEGVLSQEEIQGAIMQNFNHPVCFQAGSTAWNGKIEGCTGKIYRAEDVGLQSPRSPGGDTFRHSPGFGSSPFAPGMEPPSGFGFGEEQMGDQALRECENLKRPLTEGFIPEDMRASLKSPVESIFQECVTAAKAAMASAQGDPRTMDQFFQSMSGFYQKLDVLMRSGSSCIGVKMQIKGMTEGAKNADREITQMEKTKKSVAAEMRTMQQETLKIAEKAKGVVASGKCEEAASLLHEHQGKMEEVFGTWGHGTDDTFFMDERAAAVEFTKQVGSGSEDVDALLRHYDTEDLKLASEIVNYGGKELMQLLQDEKTANLIKSVNQGGNNQAVLIATMMQRIKDLEAKVSTLERELSDTQKRYAEELLAITPAPQTGILIEDFVQNQLPALEGLPPETIEQMVNRYKQLNGEELKKLGIVQFADTDPKDWYTPHAAKAADAGIITGEGESGNFNPGGLVNGAQLTKILATAMGLEPVEGAASDNPHFAQYPTWSQGYIVALAEEGMQLSAYVSTDPAKPVEKIQLATALAQLIDEGSFRKSGFSKVFTDLGGRSDQEKQAVAVLSSLGVVSGEGNGDTFQPKAGVSRAVLAKMIGNMLDLIAASGKQR